MKKLFSLSRIITAMLLVLLSFTIRAQELFPWLQKPEFDGITVDWVFGFIDTTASDSIPRGLFLPNNKRAFYRDVLVHSDGDIVVLSNGGYFDRGYLLSKHNPKTGALRWIKILTNETSTVDARRGQFLYEKHNGDIELIGLWGTPPYTIPHNGGIYFRTDFDAKTGAIKEDVFPGGFPLGLLGSSGWTTVVPSIDERSYFQVTGKNSGFIVRKLSPDFTFDKVQTILEVDTLRRDGQVVLNNTGLTTFLKMLPNKNLVFSFNFYIDFLKRDRMLSKLVWLNTDGELLKMVDLTHELGFPGTFSTIPTDKGYLVYTSRGFADSLGGRPFAAMVDLNGNILWSKKLFEEKSGIQKIHMASLPNGGGFLVVHRAWNEHWLTFYKLSYDGEVKELGKLSPKKGYDYVYPKKLSIGKNNEVFFNFTVGLDTLGMKHEYHRSYLLKIDGSELGIVSADREVAVKKNSLKVFPNPTDYSLTVALDWTSKRPKKVRLLNNLGEIVLERAFDLGASNSIIDVSQLSVGMYQLQVWEKDSLIGTEKVSIVR